MGCISNALSSTCTESVIQLMNLLPDIPWWQFTVAFLQTEMEQDLQPGNPASFIFLLHVFLNFTDQSKLGIYLLFFLWTWNSKCVRVIFCGFFSMWSTFSRKSEFFWGGLLFSCSVEFLDGTAVAVKAEQCSMDASWPPLCRSSA